MSRATLNIKPKSTVTLNVRQAPPRLVPLNIQTPGIQTGVQPPVRLNLQPGTQGQIQLNITSPQYQPSPGDGHRITADVYQGYDTARDHIYNVTDAYIGSDEQVPRPERVLNLETMSFQEQEITIP